MTRLSTLIFLAGAIAMPAVAQAEQVTATVGGHDMTYTTAPQTPAVVISPKDAIAIASQAKPSKPRVPIDPKAKAPTLK